MHLVFGAVSLFKLASAWGDAQVSASAASSAFSSAVSAYSASLAASASNAPVIVSDNANVSDLTDSDAPNWHVREFSFKYGSTELEDIEVDINISGADEIDEDCSDDDNDDDDICDTDQSSTDCYMSNYETPLPCDSMTTIDATESQYTSFLSTSPQNFDPTATFEPWSVPSDNWEGLPSNDDEHVFHTMEPQYNVDVSGSSQNYDSVLTPVDFEASTSFKPADKESVSESVESQIIHNVSPDDTPIDQYDGNNQQDPESTVLPFELSKSLPQHIDSELAFENLEPRDNYGNFNGYSNNETREVATGNFTEAPSTSLHLSSAAVSVVSVMTIPVSVATIPVATRTYIASSVRTLTSVSASEFVSVSLFTPTASTAMSMSQMPSSFSFGTGISGPDGSNGYHDGITFGFATQTAQPYYKSYPVESNRYNTEYLSEYNPYYHSGEIDGYNSEYTIGFATPVPTAGYHSEPYSIESDSYETVYVHSGGYNGVHTVDFPAPVPTDGYYYSDQYQMGGNRYGTEYLTEYYPYYHPGGIAHDSLYTVGHPTPVPTVGYYSEPYPVEGDRYGTEYLTEYYPYYPVGESIDYNSVYTVGLQTPVPTAAYYSERYPVVSERYHTAYFTDEYVNPYYRPVVSDAYNSVYTIGFETPLPATEYYYEPYSIDMGRFGTEYVNSGGLNSVYTVDFPRPVPTIGYRHSEQYPPENDYNTYYPSITVVPSHGVGFASGGAYTHTELPSAHVSIVHYSDSVIPSPETIQITFDSSYPTLAVPSYPVAVCPCAPTYNFNGYYDGGVHDPYGRGDGYWNGGIYSNGSPFRVAGPHMDGATCTSGESYIHGDNSGGVYGFYNDEGLYDYAVYAPNRRIDNHGMDNRQATDSMEEGVSTTQSYNGAQIPEHIDGAFQHEDAGMSFNKRSVDKRSCCSPFCPSSGGQNAVAVQYAVVNPYNGCPPSASPYQQPGYSSGQYLAFSPPPSDSGKDSRGGFFKFLTNFLSPSNIFGGNNKQKSQQPVYYQALQQPIYFAPPPQPVYYQQPQQSVNYQQPQQPINYQQTQQPVNPQSPQPAYYQQPQQPVYYQQAQQPVYYQQQPVCYQRARPQDAYQQTQPNAFQQNYPQSQNCVPAMPTESSSVTYPDPTSIPTPVDPVDDSGDRTDQESSISSSKIAITSAVSVMSTAYTTGTTLTVTQGQVGTTTIYYTPGFMPTEASQSSDQVTSSLSPSPTDTTDSDPDSNPDLGDIPEQLIHAERNPELQWSQYKQPQYVQPKYAEPQFTQPTYQVSQSLPTQVQQPQYKPLQSPSELQQVQPVQGEVPKVEYEQSANQQAQQQTVYQRQQQPLWYQQASYEQLQPSQSPWMQYQQSQQPSQHQWSQYQWSQYQQPQYQWSQYQRPQYQRPQYQQSPYQQPQYQTYQAQPYRNTELYSEQVPFGEIVDESLDEPVEEINLGPIDEELTDDDFTLDEPLYGQTRRISAPQFQSAPEMAAGPNTSLMPVAPQLNPSGAYDDQLRLNIFVPYNRAPPLR